MNNKASVENGQCSPLAKAEKINVQLSFFECTGCTDLKIMMAVAHIRLSAKIGHTINMNHLSDKILTRGNYEEAPRLWVFLKTSTSGPYVVEEQNIPPHE